MHARTHASFMHISTYIIHVCMHTYSYLFILMYILSISNFSVHSQISPATELTYVSKISVVVMLFELFMLIDNNT